MSDRSDAAALSYLERLLRMAVIQRGTPPDAVAGRVMIPVLGMAMAYDGNQLLADYLTPEPGQEATYQVRRQGPGETEPTILSDDLNAAAAFRAAVRFSREGLGAIQVVGRTEGGVERRAVNRTTDGVLEYIFPTPDAYTGPDSAVRTALRRWEDTIGGWGEPGPGRAGSTQAAGRNQGTTGNEEPTSDKESTGAEDPDELGGARPDHFPTAPEIAAAIQSSLMEMTVDINLNEVESLIRRTIQGTFGELTAAARPALAAPRPDAAAPSADPTARPGALARPGGVAPIVPYRPDADQLAERIVSRVVERIKPLLISVGRQSAAASPARVPAVDDRAAEQIAAMVAYQIDSFLEALSPGGVGPVEALKQIEPVLREMDATQKQWLAHAASQVGFESRINNAVEQLDVQVQELREHMRVSAAALQALTEQVGTLSRRSEAAGERLATAVGRELDQFGDRFKHQLVTVEAAAKRTARDMPVPDAVTRLTAKLARSEAQLDQILKRLDELAPSEPLPAPGHRRIPK